MRYALMITVTAGLAAAAAHAATGSEFDTTAKAPAAPQMPPMMAMPSGSMPMPPMPGMVSGAMPMMMPMMDMCQFEKKDGTKLNMACDLEGMKKIKKMSAEEMQKAMMPPPLPPMPQMPQGTPPMPKQDAK